MSDMRFFGSYATFKTKNKKEGAAIMSADFIVGTPFSIEFIVEDGKTVAWAKNAYDDLIGYFDKNVTYRLDVMRARGWNISGLLSLVGYTEDKNHEDGGYYWGELALFAAPQKYTEEVKTFKKRVAAQLADGKRPNIDLGSSSIDTMLKAKGDWLPDRNLSAPSKKKGTAILKSSQSMSEKLVEQSRAKNKGCYAASYAFLILLAVGVFFLAKTIFGF